MSSGHDEIYENVYIDLSKPVAESPALLKEKSMSQSNSIESQPVLGGVAAHVQHHTAPERTNFEGVAYYNNVIGNRPISQADDRYWAALEKQYRLMQDEMVELKAAIDNRDFTNMREEGCDVLVTTYGLFHRAGANADADMSKINAANLSKFCTTYEEAQASVTYYASIGVEAVIHEEEGLFAIVSAKNQFDINDKAYPGGKNLKGIGFRKARLN